MIQPNKCKGCGKTMQINWQYCPDCGVDISSGSSPKKADKKKSSKFKAATKKTSNFDTVKPIKSRTAKKGAVAANRSKQTKHNNPDSSGCGWVIAFVLAIPLMIYLFSKWGLGFWWYMISAVAFFVFAIKFDEPKGSQKQSETLFNLSLGGAVVSFVAGILYLPYTWIFNPKPNMKELRQDLRDAIRAQEIYNESGGANSGMVDVWNEQLRDLQERHSAGLISTSEYLEETKWRKAEIYRLKNPDYSD